MSIEIAQRADGKWYWLMYDGPDGIDKFEGVCNTLAEVFVQVTSAILANARQYE